MKYLNLAVSFSMLIAISCTSFASEYAFQESNNLGPVNRDRRTDASSLLILRIDDDAGNAVSDDVKVNVIKNDDKLDAVPKIGSELETLQTPEINLESKDNVIK
jgi:hypothetical protein